MGALESFNPATGELLGTVATIGPDEVQAVVDDVAEVQPFWAQLTLADRAGYMRRAADVLLADMDEIGALLSREQGKPITESFSMELLPTIDALHWCADAGPKILADERIPYPQAFLKTKRSFFSYEPLGVVGVIAPWNYPWSIPLGEVAIALMAGNGVVLKPASLTPLLGDRIQRVFDDAGFPAGLVRTVHGGGVVGEALCQASTAKIFFTGSVEVGRRVGDACAQRLKGAVLELGGKDPQIVCADADLANAISGCVWGGFANSGQTCSGIERTYVVEDVAEPFLEGVRRETERLTVGDPLDWQTEIGPMVSAEQADLVTALVDDALADGAEQLTGGPREVPGFSGRFISPTVLAGVEESTRLMNEEIFGPVVPVIVVGDEAEAVERANDSSFGLGASVWTRDRAKGERIARQIESGMVWINDHSYSHGALQTSWGGVKDSGLGRSHSKFGFYECVNIKHVAWEPGLTTRHLVAAVRPCARHRAALLRPAALRPQRRPPEGLARGDRPPDQGRCARASQGPLSGG